MPFRICSRKPLEQINFDSPTVYGTIVPMDFGLEDISTTQPISGVIINTVILSPSFIFFIYMFMAVILVFSTAIFLMKKSSIVPALNKAFIVTFFSAGIIYAVHTDIGWSGWLINDARTYDSLGTDEKLLKMEGAIYAFALRPSDGFADEKTVASLPGYGNSKAGTGEKKIRATPEALVVLLLCSSL